MFRPVIRGGRTPVIKLIPVSGHDKLIGGMFIQGYDDKAHGGRGIRNREFNINA
jgi:hypothetical protein